MLARLLVGHLACVDSGSSFCAETEVALRTTGLGGSVSLDCLDCLRTLMGIPSLSVREFMLEIRSRSDDLERIVQGDGSVAATSKVAATRAPSGSRAFRLGAALAFHACAFGSRTLLATVAL